MRKTKSSNPSTKLALSGVLIVIVLSLTYSLGFIRGSHQRLTADNFSAVFRGGFGAAENSVPNFSLYETVLDLMKTKYTGDIDYLNVLYGTIKGAVAGLGDPYTSFTTPDENQEFFSSLSGTYEGVGVEIDFVGERLLVVATLEGSPAAVAGLQPKDEIVAVDGRIVTGMTISQAVSLIQGPRGSEVVLTIWREGDNDPQDVKLIRQVVKVASVRLEIKDDIAVLRISKFGSDTEQLFKKAVARILSDGAKGIVLDLRNNPGGFLDVSVKVANEFLSGGMIVEERFKDGKSTPFSADGNGKLSALPIVVLVDGGSASAAEIVAGGLRDNGRGQLVGETTYGKGSVQEVEEFSDGSALRITVAHWFTPLGTSISEGGLKPDIVVKNEETGDAQLDKAISELKKLIR